MAFINIAKDDLKPLFVDPAAVTAIHLSTDTDGKENFSLYTAEGQLFWIEPKGWNVDALEAVEKLRRGGAPLVHFPMRWPEDENTYKEYTHFINPEAVTFATISAVTEAGFAGAIVGVKGAGREESYNLSSAELGELMNAVKAVKPLLEFTPDIVEARWSRPGMLYVDPKSVVEVRDDGYQVNVYFEASGSLDVQVKNADVNEVANEIFQGGKDTRDLREIFAEAQARVKKQDADARQRFARTVAAEGQDLIEVPNSSRALFISRKNIAYINFSDDDKNGRKYMNLRAQKTASNPYPDAVSVIYATAEERQAAFDVVQAALLRKPAAAPAAPKKASPQP